MCVVCVILCSTEGTSLLFLVGDTILYGLLAWYLDAVIRGRCVCVCVCIWVEERERGVLGIERLLSAVTPAWFFLNTYTLRPRPPPAHSDWRPTRVSRVVLVDCNVVVVVRLVLFISTSHQGSSSIDHCVSTGFGPFNLPTCASLPLRRDHSHQRSLVIVVVFC